MDIYNCSRFYTDHPKTVTNEIEYIFNSANTKIKNILIKGAPAFICRIGGTDWSFATEFYKSGEKISELFRRVHSLYELIGYFDKTTDKTIETSNLLKYYDTYIHSVKEVDLYQFAGFHLISGFGFIPDTVMLQNGWKTDVSADIKLMNHLNFKSSIVHWDHENLNFKYNFFKNIFPLLEGRTILVVTPFGTDVIKQYEKKDLLFSHHPLYKDFTYPNFKLETVSCPLTLSHYKERDKIPINFTDYHQVLDDLKKKIESINFDVALLGCGSYANPLGSYIKSLGKIAIYTGGATQLFFGILGNRYEYLRKQGIVNEHWTYPTITTDSKIYCPYATDGINAYTKLST